MFANVECKSAEIFGMVLAKLLNPVRVGPYRVKGEGEPTVPLLVCMDRSSNHALKRPHHGQIRAKKQVPADLILTSAPSD